ncbi:MAG: helix-hairpin-helix domain-containing protein [Cyanobacteria bacterium MAG CAR4_bin_6]|nr:helix-hairpin-helix domain-containing protein [Cyanobacteria bacterium MAG CAR4_bin_6]
MAKRHWLDPVARSLLRATGHLPRNPVAVPAPGPDGHGDAVELELLFLKLHQNPWLPLPDGASVQRAARLGVQLDVNRAPASQWRRLPGMRWQWIDQLLQLQRQEIHVHTLAELEQRLGVSSTLLKLWQPVLAFRPRGDRPALPPLVDVNGASGQKLSDLPGLDRGQVASLLRERQRGPFSSVADLQDRLRLPDSVMAVLAGQLHCGRGPVPPDLPKPHLPREAFHLNPSVSPFSARM